MKNGVRFFLLLNMRSLLGFGDSLVPAGRSFSGSRIHGFATIEHPRP